MLSVQDIVAGYGQHEVLRGVSLRVSPGQFVGLLGPNGCGKTTLLRVISGVLKPRSGVVLLDDMDTRRIRRRKLARAFACLTQELGTGLSFTVREVAMLGRTPHLSRIAPETRRDREIVEEALAVADIAHLADRPVAEISGGERQRAFFAMCLAQQPRVLLLDEPVSHLDLGHQLAMLNLIRRLNRNSGLTVIAVFHDLNLASEFCDQLVVMNAGRHEAAGSAREVLTPEMIRRVYGVDVLVGANPVSGKPHVMIGSPQPGQE